MKGRARNKDKGRILRTKRRKDRRKRNNVKENE
jgi:hypothetical protein